MGEGFGGERRMHSFWEVAEDFLAKRGDKKRKGMEMR